MIPESQPLENSPLKIPKILKRARAEGIADSTLDRAKVSLGAYTRRQVAQGHQEHQEPQEPQTSELEVLEVLGVLRSETQGRQAPKATERAGRGLKGLKMLTLRSLIFLSLSAFLGIRGGCDSCLSVGSFEPCESTPSFLRTQESRNHGTRRDLVSGFPLLWKQTDGQRSKTRQVVYWKRLVCDVAKQHNFHPLRVGQRTMNGFAGMTPACPVQVSPVSSDICHVRF